MADRLVHTVQTISRAGVTPTFVAATAEGTSFLNDDGIVIEVKASGAEVVVTIPTPGTVDASLAIADLTVTVPATTGDKIIGPFPASVYNQTTGYVFVNFSITTGVTIAVYKVEA